MKILVVNPNSTRSMTEKIGASAAAVAAQGTEIVAVNPEDAPRSIEGHYDEAMCLPGLLDEIRKGEAAGFQGYVVACFADPGGGACREIAPGPRGGLCEGALLTASSLRAGLPGCRGGPPS